MSGDAMDRVRAIDPCAPGRPGAGPAPTGARDAVLARARRERPPTPWRQGARVAAAGALAAGAVTAAVALVPGRGGDAPTAPPVIAGERAEVVAYIRGSGDARPNFRPLPGTAHAVFRHATPAGDYTIWRARTVGPRGAATVFVSPRAGVSGSVGVGQRIPDRPYVRHEGGAAVPGAAVREVYGRASADIARVVVILKDGSRRDAWTQGGWWVFTQPFGHPKPVGLEGFDAAGRRVAVNHRPVF
ncbi:MAG: hypothetical protein AB7G65_19455 [Thermoleophilia bacterium]